MPAEHIKTQKEHSRQSGGETAATQLLKKLRLLPDAQLKTVLDVAIEYADNPAIAGKSGPAGKRLLMQLEWALEELGHG